MKAARGCIERKVNEKSLYATSVFIESKIPALRPKFLSVPWV